MAGQTEIQEQEEDQTGEGKRERSKIDFPYADLNSSLEVAQAMHAHAGISTCGIDQLAAWMNTTEASSTFRVKLSSAKTFGLVEGGKGTFKLTERGQRAVDPKTADAAKAEAFLAVELYRKVYDTFRGKMLPPTAALENQLEAFGVSAKQKDRARQVLERSAEQAGFFHSGRERLVAPGALNQKNETPPKPEESGGGKAEKQDSELHPFIQGLLDKLPAPDTDWSIPDRIEWLEATVSIFNLMYKGKGRIRIEGQGEPSKPEAGPR